MVYLIIIIEITTITYHVKMFSLTFESRLRVVLRDHVTPSIYKRDVRYDKAQLRSHRFGRQLFTGDASTMKTFALLSALSMTVVRSGFVTDVSTDRTAPAAAAASNIILHPSASAIAAPLNAAPVATEPAVRRAIAARSPVAALARPRLHEIHTHNPRPVIRLEEYSQPRQIIRVYESPQGAPQVIKLQAPAQQPSLIRVISKSKGPAHVERVLRQVSGAQVINVQKPGPAPIRIIQVVRGAEPAPRIEFYDEPKLQNQVYVSRSPAKIRSDAGYERAVADIETSYALGDIETLASITAAVPPAALASIIDAPIRPLFADPIVATVPIVVNAAGPAVSVMAAEGPASAPVSAAVTDGSGIIEPRSYSTLSRQVNGL